MWKIICGMLMMAVLLTACGGSGMSGNQEAEERDIVNIQENPEDDPEPPTVEVDKEVGPIVSEQIDTTKKGIEIPDTLYPSQVVQGDDGNCYYFRIIEKGDEKKIIFYKNNEKKVCETKMPKELRKKEYQIFEFAKYGEYFFAELFSTDESENILATITVQGGEWNILEKDTDMIYGNNIFYGDNIYSSETGYVLVYDLNGKKVREMELEKITSERCVQVQCIVDDKIYYYYTESDDVGETEIKRCDLDGSNKEVLFKYNREVPDLDKGMQIDDDYIYIIASLGGEFSFSRIPLYGGKIERISKTLNFKLSEDSIYYIGGKKDYIYRVDKDLKTKAKVVVKITASDFWHVNGYLMVETENIKEEEMLGTVVEYDECMRDYYTRDYYWTTTSGEIVKKMPGSGIKQEDLDLYERVKDWE
ncbi:MAG: DUF5050 domain-containing protein [Roseburia sp.]|nr:DUF5050 domain-containing protein [Roseburia sp.]